MKAKKQINKLKEALAEQRSLLKEIHKEVFKGKEFSVGKPFDKKELIFEETISLSKEVLRGLTEPKPFEVSFQNIDSKYFDSDCKYFDPNSEKLEDVSFEVFKGKVIDKYNYATEEKPFVLPEKWCVKVNKQEVVDYCNKYGAFKGKYIIDDTLFAHFPAFSGGACTTSCKIEKGYTEITFEQFMEHVVNASTEPQSLSTEVSTEPKPLTPADVQVNVEDCSEKEIKALADIFVANGFEVWNTSIALDVNEGKKFLSLCDKEYGVFVSQDKTTLTPSQFREIFGNSVVSKKEITDIDWSKAGQLVESDILIVMTCRVPKDNHVFTGVVVKIKDPDCGFYFKGYYSNCFNKSAFTLCPELITLENE